MHGDDGAVDLEEVLDRLRDRVAARRASGEYPEELETQLSEHFQRILAHRRAQPDDTYLRRLALELDDTSNFDPAKVKYDSRVPGGETLHRVVTKAVSRQTSSVLAQVREYADHVNELLRTLVQALEGPPQHVHDDLWERIDGLLERAADTERMAAGGPAAVAALADRLSALEAEVRGAAFEPWYSNDAFEAAFRGSRAELLERYDSLADQLVDCGPVLDIGCGRGELLELLEARGIEASGVETDPKLVAECRDLGRNVRYGDGLEVLRAAAPASLGGLTLIQVIEHLSVQQALDVVALAADRVRPGGRVVIETVNPQSLYVYAHAFYLDPTHVRPVHPAWLTFLFREAGFPSVFIDWRSPPDKEEVLEPVGDDVHDRNVERLNQVLFAPQDYALIATR